MKLPFNIDLTNKVVIVTGGAGVLGSAWVDALAECGAKVAIIGRNLENAERKAAEVVANGKIALGLAANVLDKKELKRAHDIIFAKFGPCDVLINGAGGNNSKAITTKEYLYKEDLAEQNDALQTFFDLDENGIRSTFDLNFLGIFLPSQEFSKDMIGRKGCSIINISSVTASTPLTKIPAYAGAKAAVSNFTQWLAVHLSKVGIRVNAISPGFFLAKQNEALLKNPDGTLTERSNKILNSTPMGRFGDPNDLIGALLFLVDEEASGFVNGVVIPVDGGFSAYSGV